MASLSKIVGFTILTFITLLGPLTAHSQNFYTRNFSIENGLPSNCIQDIFKDSRGYIWIGTEAGLCRFDGVNFKTYTTQDGLPGNRIWSITEDSSANLWLACYGNGISKFDGKSFKNYSTANGLINDNVRKIKYSEKNDGLLIGTIFGFSYLKDSVFTSFTDSTVTSRNLLQVTDFIDCDSIIYLLTYYDATSFIKFNPNTKVFEYLPKDHRFHIKSFFSTSAYISSKNDTIIGDYIRGVKIFSRDTLLFYEDLAQVFDITEDKSGDIWIASWNDLINNKIAGKGGIYRLKNGKTDFYSDKLGINTQLCWCLYYDENENLLWIGTLDKGLFIYSLSGVEYTSANEYNSENPQIHDIFQTSEEGLWLSVGDKIINKNENTDIFNSDPFQKYYTDFAKTFYSYLLDPEGSFGKYKNLSISGLTRFVNPYFKDGKILPEGSVYNPSEYNDILSRRIIFFETFHEDYHKNIWIKTNLGLFSTNKHGDITGFFHYPNTGYAFMIEKNNSISLLESYALNNYSQGSDKVILLRKNITYASYCNYFRENDTYWIFNDTDGILKYKDGNVKRFNYLGTEMDLSVTSLTGDKRNNLIAGTNSGLIYIFTTENDSLKVIGKISPDDGIRGSDIKWVLNDNANRLWFSTNKGLNMFDLEKFYNEGKKDVSFFNDENGFFDKRTSKAIYYENNIEVISENNILKYDPDELILSSQKKPKLKIEKIEINFSEYIWPNDVKTDNWSGLPMADPVWDYNKNTLSFYFHLLQYSEPSKTEFSYKLNEIQDEWTNFQTEDKAVFTNMRPGKYILDVRSRILSNPWNTYELKFPFQILPPWYSTWWFSSFIVIIIISVIYLYIISRIGRIRKESEINQKLATLKLEALKSQMNPHFIFNAFNSIQKYILNQDSKAALNYMSDFATLIRKTLNNSTKELIPLSDEISYLKSYIELEKRRIPILGYQISVESNIDTEELYLPPMLLQPVVENSILHGIRHMNGEGIITINFNLSEKTGKLICSIEDNGIGRAESAKIYNNQGKTNSSMGSLIILERASLFGIKVLYTDLESSGISFGTRVDFYF